MMNRGGTLACAALAAALASSSSFSSAAVTGSLRGVVLAERPDSSGRPQLLLAVPADLGGQAVDEIRLDLPQGFRGRLRPDLLPKGWSLDLSGRRATLTGPPLSAERLLAVALGSSETGGLQGVGLRLSGAGRELLAGTGDPLQMARVATIDAVGDLVQLPRSVSPGETVRFSPLDGTATPPGGEWEIDGSPTEWDGRFDDASYRWPVSAGYEIGLDLSLRVRYRDPWGETLLDGTWDKTRVSAPQDSSAGPRITGCSPKVLSAGTLCVCGHFPEASRSRLTVNGQSLGTPISASSHVLHFPLPEGTLPGTFTVAGEAQAGFSATDQASGIHVAVGGEIDRSRLMRGESTPLRLWLEGTDEPLSLRLWNTTPAIVSLVGGEDQIVTTSGGRPNQLVRTVNAVSPGDFDLRFSLELDSCPCAADDTTVANDTTATSPGETLRTVSRGCDQSRAQCDELRLRAESLETTARSLRRAAERAAQEQQRYDEEAGWLDELSEGDRAQIEILRRQAREWRQLAANARASAAKNWERHRKYPGYNWDHWARLDEQEARRRDGEAERLEREARELENRAKERSDRARELRDIARRAEAKAAAAEAEAAAARAAYQDCLRRLAEICPDPTTVATGTTTTGGSGTSVTEGGGTAPPDTGQPPPYGEEDDDEEKICPQRDGNHKSCVALIVDIARHDTWRPGSLTDTKAYLESMQCDLDYVAPRFHDVPPPSYMVEKEIWSWSDLEFKTTRYWVNTSASREAAQSHNRRQSAQINAAIESHRTKLRAGAILGLEMVYAHGSKKGVNSCGRLGPSPDWWNTSFERKDFHQGNYDAAKGNVCIWYFADMSCYSHMSARIADNLNNKGRATCSGDLAINRAFHAGYEADIAHTCSKQGLIEVCSNADVAYLEDDIDDVFEDEIPRQSGSGYGAETAFRDALSALRDAANSSVFSFSTYADQGHEMCVPDQHTQRGPYWKD